MNNLSGRLIRLIACISLVAGQSTFAKPSNPGGGAAGKTNSGNTFDCAKNPNLCTGNSGSGVGNAGPGNQGNDGTNGNTGSGGSSNAGNGNGGNSNAGNGNGGNSNAGNGNGGSTNGGSSNPGNGNGGSTNGGSVNGGNGNSGNPFDCSRNANLCTGNNGNGNGNTGPGNQGNDGSNGNAGGGNNGGNQNGGSTNGGNQNGGSTNGGNQNGGSTNGGNQNGGSTNGGNQNSGSTNGGNQNGGSTNGGNQNGGSTNGGSTTGGSTTGGSTTGGSTTGGSTTGGSTDGGSTTGGSTTGGSTTGGSTNGGSTTGGSTTGGTTDGGSTTGGSTTGGSTTGGSTTGGTTDGGSTTGGSTNGGTTDGGSTTGGSTTGGSTDGGTTDGGSTNGGDVDPIVDEPAQQPERSLGFKVQPLFYMDYDLGAGIVAVDTAEQFQRGQSNVLRLTRQASLYQKSSFELLEGGLGAALGLYFKNATGTVASWWAQVGLLPMKGTEISSVRYFNSLAAAKAGRGYKSAPLDVTAIYKWQLGDNVTYKSKGGLIFVGGTGLGLGGLTSTKLAQGTWETYVEKVDTTQVYVKITSSKLEAYSNGAGLPLTAAARTSFDNADDGFSYLIDLQSEDGRKVYHDLVRGNVTAAQRFAEKIQASPEAPAVMKVEKFKRKSKGNGTSFFFGIPIFLNATTAENNVQSHNMSDMFIQNSKVDAQFGVYDFTARTRAFGTHTTQSKGFYGVSYSVSDLTTGALKEKSDFGRFSWVYQDDNSSMRTLHRNMESLLQETGLDQVKVVVPNVAGDLDFTNITLNITLNGDNASKLKNSLVGRSARQMKSWSQQRVKYAYSKKGDALCDSVNEHVSCESRIMNETVYAAEKMQEALTKMRARSGNAKAYTQAYAEFGKAAMTNQITLAMAMSLAGPGVEVSFALEGTYFKAHRMSLVTTAVEGRYELMDPRSQQEDSSLDSQGKRSRYHGVITNKNFTGLGAP